VTIIVTSLGDVAQPNATTLRQAIGLANATPGSTISFDPALFAAGPGVIALAGSLPDIAQATTIDGPGAAKLSVLGGGSTAYRILTVDAGATANLSGLTIDGGNVQGGGSGIINRGTMSIARCTFLTNYAEAGAAGGAIENLGTADVVDSLFTRNGSGLGGAIDNNVGGTMTVLSRRAGVGGSLVSSGLIVITADVTRPPRPRKDCACIGSVSVSSGSSSPSRSPRAPSRPSPNSSRVAEGVAVEPDRRAS